MITCPKLNEDISESFCKLCKLSLCVNHPDQIRRENEKKIAKELYSLGMVFCSYRDKLIDIRWCNRCKNSTCKWHPIQRQSQRYYSS